MSDTPTRTRRAALAAAADLAAALSSWREDRAIAAEKSRDKAEKARDEALAKRRKKARRAGHPVCEHGHCTRPVDRTGKNERHCEKHHQGTPVVEHAGAPRDARRRVQLRQRQATRQRPRLGGGRATRSELDAISIPKASNTPYRNPNRGRR